LILVNVKDDRVMVTVDPGKFTTDQTTFYIPTTVPGTYSIDNYGTLIEDLKAFDYLGKELLLAKTDDNSWLIDNAGSR
jgi:predicted metalloprotease with PDZ domain